MSVFVCVCEREIEIERVSVSVTQRVVCVCVYVCGRERKSLWGREKDRCVCVESHRESVNLSRIKRQSGDGLSKKLFPADFREKI